MDGWSQKGADEVPGRGDRYQRIPSSPPIAQRVRAEHWAGEEVKDATRGVMQAGSPPNPGRMS